MPITDPIFIPKDKDPEFPSEFWIIPACTVDLAGTQEEINCRRKIRRHVNQLEGSKMAIKIVSEDWSEEIKSLAVWDIDSDALIKLIEKHAPGFCYHVVAGELTLIDFTHGHSQLGSFREQLRANRDRPTCCIYVISLNDEFLGERRCRQRFHKANPNYVEGQKCYYVGMTSKTPEERFAQHKSDHSASSPWVNNYGIRLEPGLYEHIPLLSKAEAKVMEVSHAEYLRSQGYGVWQR